MSAEVRTVLGPVDPSTIGFTLPHEHTAISLWNVPNRWDDWELRRDEETMLAELARFREAGGSCLVDLTGPGVGRDPEWLRGLATKSGLHIVMGCGWYRGAYYPAEAAIDRRSVNDLADELVTEIEVGVPGTDVRAGIVGEIGTDKPWVTPTEERVHRAAARAARRTGLAITTHAIQSEVGLDQLRIFEEEGADLARVVIGHADSNPSAAYYRAIIERGANLEFDFLGMAFTPIEQHREPRLIRLLLELLAAGFEERVLLSQDVCHDSQLQAYGGNGYTYLSTTFLPRLREAGVPETAIRQMTVDNPRRILTVG